MRRRTFHRILIGCAAIAVLPCGFFGLWIAAAGGSNKGSPTLATEWRDHLARYADPDAAQLADPEIIILRCQNGEWAFGRSSNSHGMWIRGGGTIVVRDSVGRTRVFFGQVCGRYDLGARGSEPISLDAYYEGMAESRFVEHNLP